MYIADAGLLMRIKDGYTEIVNFEPSYLTPDIIRSFKNDLYILTKPWQDDDGYYFGIIRLGAHGAEGIHISEADYISVEDFTFSRDGLIFYILRNDGLGITYLNSMNPNDPDDIVTLCEIPSGTSSLAVGDRGEVYLANPDTGAICVWRDGELGYFAGVEGEKAFIDGIAPLFYMPQNISFADGFLYVWDFNVMRRVAVSDGFADECITIAGEASPTFDLDVWDDALLAEDIIFPNSMLMDFAVTEDGVLITDPKRGLVWLVEH